MPRRVRQVLLLSWCLFTVLHRPLRAQVLNGELRGTAVTPDSQPLFGGAGHIGKERKAFRPPI